MTQINDDNTNPLRILSYVRIHDNLAGCNIFSYSDVLFLAFLALLAKAPGYRFNYLFFLFVGRPTYGAISLG